MSYVLIGEVLLIVLRSFELLFTRIAFKLLLGK
jgi:hypothetical protein